MKQNFCLGLIVLVASLMTGNLIYQPTFGQSDITNEIAEDKYQQDKEKFLELGEEKFREDCYKNLNQDNKIAEDILEYMDEDLAKELCEDTIDRIKNETGTLQQNQTLDSVTGETTYTTHDDYSNGFTVEYPTDWQVSYDGDKIFKGTREFATSIYDDPKYSVLDTNTFGSIIFDNKKDEDGIKITDDLGQLMIGNEPALSFSYSELDKEHMVVALMHNNVGYVFDYGTLNENFDKDFDTMMHFIGTLRLN
jgi:hypothetical protein